MDINFENISKTQEFMQDVENIDDLTEILSRNDLNLESEETAFRIAILWIQEIKEDNRQRLEDCESKLGRQISAFGLIIPATE